MSTPIEEYLKLCNNKPEPAMLSYVANLQQVAAVGPEIAADVVKELENQRSHLKLVASENYCSLNVQAAMGNLLTEEAKRQGAGVVTTSIGKHIELDYNQIFKL